MVTLVTEKLGGGDVYRILNSRKLEKGTKSSIVEVNLKIGGCHDYRGRAISGVSVGCSHPSLVYAHMCGLANISDSITGSVAFP